MMFMKSIDRFFCFSPASTATCSSTAAQPGGRGFRRRVERLGGHTPKSRNSASHSSSPWVNPVESRRKSSSDVPDHLRRGGTSAAATPPGSPFIDHLLAIDSKNVKAALFRRQGSNEPPGVLRRPWPASAGSQEQSPAAHKNSNKADSLLSTPVPRRNHQVVELRVSIHCKGCERKVKKHLSKMEGVTWYSIDACTQKVTVVGDVSPLGVLASISKVKNAQFWST